MGSIVHTDLTPAVLPSLAGPLRNTIADFWRMIWEFKLSAVIMLTETIEAGKVCVCVKVVCSKLTISQPSDPLMTLPLSIAIMCVR